MSPEQTIPTDSLSAREQCARTRAAASTASSMLKEGMSNAAIRSAVRLKVYREDFERFALHELKIGTKEGDLLPFDLRNRPAQQTYLKSIQQQLEERDFAMQIWLKNRQQGGSTLAEGLVYQDCSLNPGRNGLVVAHDKDTAEHLFRIGQTFYDYMSPDIRPMVRHSTRSEFRFDNPDSQDRLIHPGLKSSIMIATARNVHSGAGRTLHAVHLSEASRYENPDVLQTAVFDAVPTSHKSFIIVESTAAVNMGGNSWFRDLCDTAAKKPHGTWKFTFCGWHFDPSCRAKLSEGEVLDFTEEEHDMVTHYGLTQENILFRRIKIEQYGGNVNLFRQSYPLTPEECWLEAGEPVFSEACLLSLHTGVRPAIFEGDIDITKTGSMPLITQDEGPLRIWEFPQRGEDYDIGFDVAGGVGGDYSVACVIKRSCKEQVAIYRSSTIKPGEEQVGILSRLGWMYNTAQIAVEINSIGLYTNGELNKIYPNMHIWKLRDRVGSKSFTNQIGWLTTHQTKKYLVGHAIDRMESGKVTIRDQVTMNELRAFREEKGPTGEPYYGAAGNAYDDCVIALFIALLASYDETIIWHKAVPVNGIKDSLNPMDTMDPACYDRNWDAVLNEARHAERNQWDQWNRSRETLPGEVW